jgi:hypothetical protein
MKTISILFTVLVDSLAGSPSLADLDFTNFCVAGICLERSNVSVESVRRKLGMGFVSRRRGDAEGKSYCYYDRVNKIWVEFTFSSKNSHSDTKNPRLEGITLTTVAMCTKSAESQISFEPRAGALRIGQSESGLVQIMGNPNRIDDAILREKKTPEIAQTRYSARFGERVYVYDRENDLGFVFVFIRNGRISTIWQSISE